MKWRASQACWRRGDWRGANLELFLKLRDVFYQIDTRFGQIGPRGIFTALDGCGVLDHKVAAVDNVEAAMREPPAVGRAKLRGEVVRRLSGQGRAGCSWMAVSAPDGRTLDLGDPFAAAEAWEHPPVPPPRSAARGARRGTVRRFRPISADDRFDERKIWPVSNPGSSPSSGN